MHAYERTSRMTWKLELAALNMTCPLVTRGANQERWHRKRKESNVRNGCLVDLRKCTVMMISDYLVRSLFKRIWAKYSRVCETLRLPNLAMGAVFTSPSLIFLGKHLPWQLRLLQVSHISALIYLSDLFMGISPRYIVSVTLRIYCPKRIFDYPTTYKQCTASISLVRPRVPPFSRRDSCCRPSQYSLHTEDQWGNSRRDCNYRSSWRCTKVYAAVSLWHGTLAAATLLLCGLICSGLASAA